MNVLGPSVLACAATGALPETNGNRRPGAVPRGVFPCAGEDTWCAIEVNDDRDWQGLVDALGAPEWMREDQFKTLPGREAHQDEIEAQLAQETRRYSAAELVQRLQTHGVAAAKVATAPT